MGACAAAERSDRSGQSILVARFADIGGSRASLAMQCRRGLGIAAADVRPSVADTDSVGYTA